MAEYVDFYGAGPNNGRSLKNLIVYEVSKTLNLLDDIYGELEDSHRKREEEEIRRKELKQLEELQKKYGK